MRFTLSLAASRLHSYVMSTGREDAPLFSPREAQVLELLVAGCANRHIAVTLCLSVRTVESHVASICSKLGVHSRGQAVATTIARGLMSPFPKSELVQQCEAVNGVTCIP